MDTSPTPPPPKMSRRRGCLMGLGVLLFSSLVLVGTGEVMARHGFVREKAADARTRGSPIGFDRTFGFKGVPGFQGIVGGIRVGINEQGFRDDSWEEKLRRAQAHPERPRILLLGDSMTYGYLISKDYRLSEQLESCYAKHAGGAEVFNAAIPGYGPAEQLRVLERFLPVIRPATVVLRYCSNDFGDSALPYDYRSPNRVYKPWYTVEGTLALNERVPRRFSLKVRDTFLNHFDLKYAVDRLQYTFDDLRYQKWGVYSALDINPADKEHRTAVIAHLGHLATDPASAGLFARQKPRVLALWGRMRDLCRESGARFQIIGTVDVLSKAGEPGFLAEVGRTDLPFLNYHDPLAPWQPWAYVEGDGHPNLVDNYVVATALYNELEKDHLPADFADASWIRKIPFALEMSGNREEHLLRWGPWGKTAHRMRDATSESRLLLRNPAVNGEVDIEITGMVPAPHPGQPAEEETMQLLLPGSASQHITLPREGAFDITFHLPATKIPVLFLKINMEGALGNKPGNPASRSVKIHTATARAAHPA